MMGWHDTFFTARILSMTSRSASMWPVFGQETLTSMPTRSTKSLSISAISTSSSLLPKIEATTRRRQKLISGAMSIYQCLKPGCHNPTLLMAPPFGRNCTHEYGLHGNHVHGRIHERL